MNKYQETLDNILFYCGHANYDKYLNPKIFEELKIIQELVDQTKSLTLDECIKEWEERGFVFNNYDTLLIFDSAAKDIAIEIYTNHMWIMVWDYDRNEIQSLDFDLVFLLSKTLKALEVNNNEKL